MKTTMKKVLPAALLAVSALLLGLPLAGCGPAKEKAPAEGEAREDPAELRYAQILAAVDAGKTEEALALAEKALDDPECAGQKPRFQELRVRLLLDAGRPDAARDIADAAWASDPAFAPAAAELVARHYRARKEFPVLLAWSLRLAAPDSPFPPEARKEARFRVLEAAARLRKEADFRAALRTLLASADHPPLSRIEGCLTPPLNDKETAGFVMGQIAAALPAAADKDVRNLFLRLNLRGTLTLKEWDAAGRAFAACIPALGDDRLLAESRRVYAAFKAAAQTNRAEAAAKAVFTGAPEKKRSASLAAGQWVDCGMNADSNALPARLDALLAAKVDPNRIGDLFDRYFYRNVDNLNLVRTLCGMGRQILARCTDADTANNLKLRILDGAFITENYAAVVELLEKGVPGKDRAWHALSLPKVKAHLALQQNKPREAVAYFREFMKRMDLLDQGDEYDPTTGIAYSKEWLLGRNAARIAKILDSVGDKQEADKARAEAKGYFLAARKKAEKDPAALKALREEAAPFGL